MRTAVNFIQARLGIRARLTLLYGGMFLLAGGALIGICYLIFWHNYPGGKAIESLAGNPVHLRPSQVEAVRQKLDLHRGRALGIVVTQCLLALAVVGVAAAGFGWIMAGRALSPVRRITGTARRVADRNLGERIALAGPHDELKELADTFDAMLERLDASFDSQRQFVANASHELRTPLATSRTLIEVAIASGRVPPGLRQLVDTILATSSRSELIIDGLLTLARSDSEAIRRLPVDLSDIAAGAVEQTAHEAAAARVTVDAVPYPAVTIGDPVLLERLALNLIRNGIRHNYPDGWVTVSTASAVSSSAGREPGGDAVELAVTNSGPVVPPQQLETLFQPFRRLDGSRATDSQGVGLGLSIVRSVVHSHGGTLLATPRESGGLAIRVLLPAAPHDDKTPSTEMIARSSPANNGITRKSLTASARARRLTSADLRSTAEAGGMPTAPVSRTSGNDSSLVAQSAALRLRPCSRRSAWSCRSWPASARSPWAGSCWPARTRTRCPIPAQRPDAVGAGR
jgi:signal transduction histidine kinase